MECAVDPSNPPPKDPFDIDSVNLLFVCVVVYECKYSHKASQSLSRGLDGEWKYNI